MRDDFHRQQEVKEQRLVEEERKRQLERDEALAQKLQKEEEIANRMRCGRKTNYGGI